MIKKTVKVVNFMLRGFNNKNNLQRKKIITAGAQSGQF